MASWIIPALKAVLPHVGTIISAAKPMFTKAKPEAEPGGVPADAPVQQQIAELQAAAAQNDANVRELAEQLQQAVTALEAAAEQAQGRAQRMLRICQVAVLLAAVAVCLSLFALFMR